MSAVNSLSNVLNRITTSTRVRRNRSNIDIQQFLT